MSMIFKDIRGNWAVDTNVPCKNLPKDYFLTITTRRSYNGAYYTSATVSKRTEFGCEHVIYQDFSQRINVAKFRATEKTVKRFHDDNVNLAFRNEIEKQAVAHYQCKGVI